MLTEDFLKILCCPETKQSLRVASADCVEKINARIRKGEIKNKAGVTVSETIDGGLIREDGKVLYPVRKDIPILLIGEALPL